MNRLNRMRVWDTRFRIRFAGWIVCMLGWGLISMPAAMAADPAVGDTYVYRLVDAYTKAQRGTMHFQVTAIDKNQIAVAYNSPDMPARSGGTEIYDLFGNWRRRTIESHGEPLELEFPAASPDHAVPLKVGRTWSIRYTGQSGKDRRNPQCQGR